MLLFSVTGSLRQGPEMDSHLPFCCACQAHARNSVAARAFARACLLVTDPAANAMRPRDETSLVDSHPQANLFVENVVHPYFTDEGKSGL